MLLRAREEGDIVVNRAAVFTIVGYDLVNEPGFTHHGRELQVLFAAAAADDDRASAIAGPTTQVDILCI